MKCITIILLSICAIYSSLLAQANLDSGLVAYYQFNDNADDESGNANHGTINNAILTTDRFGNDSSAYEFDGMSSYISIPNSPTLQSPINEVTQVAWINIYDWSLVGTQFGPILMKSDNSSNSFQYRLSVSSGGVNTAINGWSNAVTNPATLNFNEWYMVASTLKNDTVRSYLNGTFIGDGHLSGTINSSTLPLEIGRDVPGSIEIFNGKIDDIRIYNRALTDQEIQDVYNNFSTSINKNKNHTPKSYVLDQNYPNPFNPTTRLSFSLTRSEYVTLKVYDIAGKEITVLVDDYIEAGTHSVNFDAGNLSSGIYFYCLRAGKFKQTDKMLLSR